MTTASANGTELRWDPYLLFRGSDFPDFWHSFSQSSVRRVLYVLGKGFDPRMCSGLRSLLAAGVNIASCVRIDFDEGTNSPSHLLSGRVARNLDDLSILLSDKITLLNKPLQVWATDDIGRRYRVSDRNAALIFRDPTDFAEFTDVIIDISALPRGIYFPLIGSVLALFDNFRIQDPNTLLPNLHVIVAENAHLDRKISDAGVDEAANYLHGFHGDMAIEATAGIPKVWVPILGENQATQLDRIYTLIEPDEICPIMPFPSVNPRRGDHLLAEYREFLLDRWRVEPQNIVYADEQNPFEVYRQIHKVTGHYYKALAPLGGCKVAVSAASSKLLSLGALMAAYETKGYDPEPSIGIAHVEAYGHALDTYALETDHELFSLWLTGDCYDKLTIG